MAHIVTTYMSVPHKVRAHIILAYMSVPPQSYGLYSYGPIPARSINSVGP